MRVQTGYRRFKACNSFGFKDDGTAAGLGQCKEALDVKLARTQGKVIFFAYRIVHVHVRETIAMGENVRTVRAATAVIVPDIKRKRKDGRGEQNLKCFLLKILPTAAIFNANFDIGIADGLLTGIAESDQ